MIQVEVKHAYFSGEWGRVNERLYKSVQWLIEMKAAGHTIPDELRKR